MPGRYGAVLGAVLCAAWLRLGLGFHHSVTGLTRPGPEGRHGQRTAGMLLQAKPKRRKDFDYSQYFVEEELEEGIWPTSPAPWEADLGPMDPYILSPEDYDSEEDFGDAAEDEGEEAPAVLTGEKRSPAQVGLPEGVVAE
jgi:hypothetical protein